MCVVTRVSVPTARSTASPQRFRNFSTTPRAVRPLNRSGWAKDFRTHGQSAAEVLDEEIAIPFRPRRQHVSVVLVVQHRRDGVLRAVDVHDFDIVPDRTTRGVRVTRIRWAVGVPARRAPQRAVGDQLTR